MTEQASRLLVNPQRIDCAMRLRRVTAKTLAESVGKTSRAVAKWRKPSDYSLYLTESEIDRMAKALQFPSAWFTEGDEEEDFANAAMLGEEIGRHWGGE